MPTLSMFFGIIIRMYYAPKEHNPAHIHAYFQEYKASVKILDGEIINGTLPSRQIKLVLAWIEIHKDELIADWELASTGRQIFQIDPLK